MLALIGPNGAGKSTTSTWWAGSCGLMRGDVRLAWESLVGLPRAPSAGARAAPSDCRNLPLFDGGGKRTGWPCCRQTGASCTGGGPPPPTAGPMRWPCWSARACTPGRPPLQRPGGDVKRVEWPWRWPTGQAALMDEPTGGWPGRAFALMALTRQIARERMLHGLFTEHSMDVVLFGRPTRAGWCAAVCWPEGTPEQIQADAPCKRPTWAQALM